MNCGGGGCIAPGVAHIEGPTHKMIIHAGLARGVEQGWGCGSGACSISEDPPPLAKWTREAAPAPTHTPHGRPDHIAGWVQLEREKPCQLQGPCSPDSGHKCSADADFKTGSSFGSVLEGQGSCILSLI